MRFIRGRRFRVRRRHNRRSFAPHGVLGLAAVVLAAAVIDAAVLQPTTQDGPSRPDIAEHFKYGSVGTEERVGVPYWIWRVLPVVFADKLPPRPGTGYERLGFMLEPGTPHGRP